MVNLTLQITASVMNIELIMCNMDQSSGIVEIVQGHCLCELMGSMPKR